MGRQETRRKKLLEDFKEKRDGRDIKKGSTRSHIM